MFVKENENVKTRADLQNLVTSVILRQTGEFSLDDIVRKANLRLIGSSYYASEDLTACCSDTLHKLFVIGGIQSAGEDRYSPGRSWPAI